MAAGYGGVCIVSLIAETDVNSAVRLALAGDTPDSPRYMYESLLKTVAKTDREKAFSMLIGGIERKEIEGSSWSCVDFLTEWGNEDPAGVAKRVLTISSDSIRTNTLEGIIAHWEKREPKAAIDWLDEQGDETLKGHGIGQCVDQWADNDPKEAAENLE